VKSLVMALLTVIIMAFNASAVAPVHSDIPNETSPCLNQDVWVYVRHQGFYEAPCIVVVHVPKYSLQGDFQNCPAEDTTVLGQGRNGPGLNNFSGMHIVTLKKGKLNNPKNYTTKPPKKIEVPANNINTWHVSK